MNLFAGEERGFAVWCHRHRQPLEFDVSRHNSVPSYAMSVGLPASDSGCMGSFQSLGQCELELTRIVNLKHSGSVNDLPSSNKQWSGISTINSYLTLSYSTGRQYLIVVYASTFNKLYFFFTENRSRLCLHGHGRLDWE